MCWGGREHNSLLEARVDTQSETSIQWQSSLSAAVHTIPYWEQFGCEGKEPIPSQFGKVVHRSRLPSRVLRKVSTFVDDRCLCYWFNEPCMPFLTLIRQTICGSTCENKISSS